MGADLIALTVTVLIEYSRPEAALDYHTPKQPSKLLVSQRHRCDEHVVANSGSVKCVDSDEKIFSRGSWIISSREGAWRIVQSA